jgi:nucleotide-binding universal stress UspA family protein
MFKTIVLATDGSDSAAAAESQAVELAKQDGAKLILVHVHERILGKGGGDLQADEPEVEQQVKSRADEISKDGIETSVEIRDVMLGGPAHPIAELAEQAGADLIVIGSRGLSSVSGVLLGSVAQRLLHLAKCPVLVVPPG